MGYAGLSACSAGADDIQNIARMYYRVLTHCGRTCGQQQWRLYLDENSSLDWDDITGYIRRTRVARFKPYFLSLFEDYRERFYVIEVSKQDSRKEPLVQLADIFVGLGCFSVDKRDKFKVWTQARERYNQPALFPNNGAECRQAESRAELARFELIAELSNHCKVKRLGVSLKRRWHLWTPQPRRPINFWIYEPQHDLDKAPTRLKG
ncbi:MAG: hypothetical protein HQ578_06680 [Chloroflexi bacterium]|nr:hypothetical protein [Chloroflexota bacterium]